MDLNWACSHTWTDVFGKKRERSLAEFYKQDTESSFTDITSRATPSAIRVPTNDMLLL